ncbi:MAG: hypothetical protein ACK42F_12900, partial [Sphingobacteriales bacterium]
PETFITINYKFKRRKISWEEFYLYFRYTDIQDIITQSIAYVCKIGKKKAIYMCLNGSVFFRHYPFIGTDNY